MLSKVPKNLLAVGVALPLSVISLDAAAIDASRDVTSVEILNVVAPQRVEYSVRGKNLDALHTRASQEFIRRVEAEIKKPGANLTISNFETDVRFENDEFVFEYRLNLNPARDSSEVHTLVDMRGTVWTGQNAQTNVLAENSTKIPEWQMRMKAAYPNMNLRYEVARSERSTPKGSIFHEAVLVKGGTKF